MPFFCVNLVNAKAKKAAKKKAAKKRADHLKPKLRVNFTFDELKALSVGKRPQTKKEEKK